MFTGENERMKGKLYIFLCISLNIVGILNPMSNILNGII